MSQARAEAGHLGRPERIRPRHLMIVLIAGLIGLGAGIALQLARPHHAAAPVTAAATLPPPLHGEATWAAGARPAPAILALHDQSGHAFSLHSLLGHTVAITFMDSHCHAACPLEGRALAAAESALPAGRRPIVVMVSVNPLDTPASTRAAARAWGLARLGAWHWLMGGPRQLAAVWRAYRITVIPTAGDITHTEAMYLLDRHGDERSGYLFPFATGFVTHDLATLAASADGRGGHV
jgi:cytochrome oxidase Cu insertion factor (SCO1/SenC/PrrC family)